MKIKADSASKKVVKEILKDIESGTIASGYKLPSHQEMAGKYGVGMSSIREAINALAVMDRVVAIQGKGTFVKNPVFEENDSKCINLYENFKNANVYSLMEIREVLECHAVKKAAEVISEEQIVVLRETFDRLKNSYTEDNLYLNEDINFHVEIARAAKNPLLGKIVQTIHLMVNQKTSVIFETSSTQNIRTAIATANEVLNFIISGDGDRAQRSMRAHLNITREIMLRTFLDEKVL